MITIPTGDLTGILADVIPFAWPDDDIPAVHAVRIEWDGTALHAMATDKYRLGWSTWQPGDALPGDEVQDDLFTEWGSGDDPWKVTIELPDAVELVKVFKLPAKQANAALTLDHEDDRRRITVKRSRDTGHTAHTFSADDLYTDEFPDLRALLGQADRITPTRVITYRAKRLADFAKVRASGGTPIELTFTKGLTRVVIGERFVGAIMPSDRNKED